LGCYHRETTESSQKQGREPCASVRRHADSRFVTRREVDEGGQSAVAGPPGRRRRSPRSRRPSFAVIKRRRGSPSVSAGTRSSPASAAPAGPAGRRRQSRCSPAGRGCGPGHGLRRDPQHEVGWQSSGSAGARRGGVPELRQGTGPSPARDFGRDRAVSKPDCTNSGTASWSRPDEPAPWTAPARHTTIRNVTGSRASTESHEGDQIMTETVGTGRGQKAPGWAAVERGLHHPRRAFLRRDQVDSAVT